MKVLVCSTEYPPYTSGIGNVAYNIVEQLKKIEVDCTVCSPYGPDINIGNGKLTEKSGIPGLLIFWNKVSKYCKKNPYDILWLHNPLLLRNLSFQKKIVTIHTTYHGMLQQKLTPKIYYRIASGVEKYCLRQKNDSTIYTAVSPQVCKELQNIGVDNKKIKYIQNGADIERFQPTNNKKTIRKKFGIPEDNTILLSVGRLTEMKQPEIMLEVFSKIKKEIKNVTLVIAGRGGLLEKAKKFVKNNKIENILFLGYVDERDKPDLYSSSDYYFMTSRYEGQPLTLFEAMASGLPCIVSDIPNLRIVNEAKCGIMVGFDDIGKSSNYIIQYLKKDNSDQSKNARNYAENFLDWKILAERYFKEFNVLFEKKN